MNKDSRYFINLFSPETAKAFTASNKDVSGFRISRKTYVENQNIGPGDKLICYVTRIMRFVGVFEVKSMSYVDDQPIFSEEEDPFVLRLKVKPIVWLPLEKSIPIREDFIWNNLSFTKSLSKSSTNWTYMVFSSPRLWPEEDGSFLEKSLLEQKEKLIEYPFSDDDQKKLRVQRIRISSNKEVTVSVPDEENSEEKQDKFFLAT